LDQITTWRAVGIDIGVDVVAPCRIVLSNGTTVEATALVKVGPPNGMVVDPKWEVLKPYVDGLLDDGFGYSVVRLDEPYDPAGDRAGMIEVLVDWGWVPTKRTS
jgi:hypothetical protein